MEKTQHNLAVRTISCILAAAGVLWCVFYVTSLAPRLNISLGYLQYTVLSAAVLLPLAFLLFRADEKLPKFRIPWYDIVAAVLSFGIPLYLFATYGQSRLAGWGMTPPTTVIILGTIMCLLVIEGARRGAGIFFALTVLLFATAPLYVHLLPGILRNLPKDPGRIIGTLFATTGGMFGSIMQIFVLVYILFVFFGVAAQVGGAGKFFANLAMSLLGRARGATAKAAIISSAMFGTISGSASANVMVSGAFTIPMMKQAGYKAHYAAAIEAAASQGGIIMPPVMGAVAFIMANFLGVPYWRVAMAAAVPALLYFWCLFSQVHIHAVNNMPREAARIEVPPLARTLLGGWHLIGTAFVLVYTLFVEKMNPGLSVLVATVAMFLFTSMRKSTRPTVASLIKLMQDSAAVFGQLAAVLLAVGLIIGGLNISGIDVSVTQWLASGTHSVPVALLILAVASLVLGMGLPGSAMYIILAVLIAPSLTNMGLNVMAVHMTILYWGLVADFTPPTAITPLIAAGFAGASPMKATWQAMRFASVIYFAPFFFILHPVILFEKFSIVPFIHVVISGFAGFYFLAQGLEGFSPPSSWAKTGKRIVILVLAVMVLSMYWYLQIAGVLLAIGVLLSERPAAAKERFARAAEAKQANDG